MDVENAVLALPGVALACVVAVPHPTYEERPVVIVQLAPGGTLPSKAALDAHLLGGKFAKFQLPDEVLHWEAVPMTSTGKLDKKAVR